MDGRAYLEKLIADRLGAGRGQPESGRRGSFNLSEIRGVATGLAAAGVLGRQDAAQILADLETTLRRSGWLQVVRQSASSTARLAPTYKRPGTERPEWRQAIEDPPAPVLRDVIPLAGRTVTAGGVTAVLLSLELWSTCFAWNLAHTDVAPYRMRERFGSRVRWHGWDDVGTRYRWGSSGASGFGGLLVERRVFEPGPPEHARLLTLAVDHPDGQDTFQLPLPAGPGSS